MSKVIRYKGQNPIKDLYLLEKELILKVQEYNKKVEEINNICVEKNKSFKKITLIKRR